MQQNPSSPYPEVFWTNSSAVLNPNCVPLGLYPTGAGPRPHQGTCSPWPGPERKRKRLDSKDGVCLCFLIVFLLVFLALTGVGLAMFQIFHLQKELEVTSVPLTQAQKSPVGGALDASSPEGEVIVSRAPKAILDIHLQRTRASIKNSIGVVFSHV